MPVKTGTHLLFLFCVELLPEFYRIGFVVTLRGYQHGEVECFHVSDRQFTDIVNSAITLIYLAVTTALAAPPSLFKTEILISARLSERRIP